jgi:hypothetical protein
MPRISFQPVYDDPKLGEEARQIVNEASSAMEAWIDKQIDSLKKEYSKKIDEAAQALEKQADEIQTQYKQIDSVLETMIGELNKLTADNSPKDLLGTLGKSKVIAESLRNDLKKREDQWKSAGVSTMKLALTAAKAALV